MSNVIDLRPYILADERAKAEGAGKAALVLERMGRTDEADAAWREAKRRCDHFQRLWSAALVK